MKKRLALLLAALLAALTVFPCAGLSEDVALTQKIATRSGPGTQYTEETGVLNPPLKVTVIAQTEGTGSGWYHIEYTRGGRTFRAYALRSKIKVTGDIPFENDSAVSDTLLYAAKAYYGPGEDYATRSGTLPAGTSVKVALTEGEWALCEYKEDGRWARGYLPAAALENTQPGSLPAAYTDGSGWSVLPEEPDTPVQAPVAEVLPGPEQPVFSQPLNAASLPQVNAAAIFFFTSPQDIYAGPGPRYAVLTPKDGLAAAGILNAGVRVYGEEDGWILIRYPSGEPGEYRYGWVTAEALSSAGGDAPLSISFSYLPALTREGLWVTFDPDIIPEDTLWLAEGTAVSVLGCLNSDPLYVYCEFNRYEGDRLVLERGFVPADMLLTP